MEFFLWGPHLRIKVTLQLDIKRKFPGSKLGLWLETIGNLTTRSTILDVPSSTVLSQQTGTQYQTKTEGWRNIFPGVS